MSLSPILAGILPSIAVGLIFWYAMRALLRADRNERAALAKAEAENDIAEREPEITDNSVQHSESRDSA